MNKSLYKITDDILQIYNLFDNAVDENGEPRDLTPEEAETLASWFKVSEDEFKTKFDSYCRLIKNFKITAENIDSERKSYKDELDRLSKRAKSAASHADRLKDALYTAMYAIKCDKFKSEFFTATIQNTADTIKPREGSDLNNVPEKYLKPRELNTTAIREDIKKGILRIGTDGEEYGKVFDTETNMPVVGVFACKHETLVIR